MAARWKLVQSFIREATEKADFTLETDMAVVYAKLRTIQRGSYSLVTGDGGLVQVSSRIGETEFSFSLPEGASPAEIMETVETALELIEGKTVAQARAQLLCRRKTTRPDFRTLNTL